MVEYRKLKGLRVQYSISQEDMASVLGIAPETYRLKENGERPFKIGEALAIVKEINRRSNEEALTVEEIFCCPKVANNGTRRD